jgi:hypothetical protein
MTVKVAVAIVKSDNHGFGQASRLRLQMLDGLRQAAGRVSALMQVLYLRCKQRPGSLGPVVRVGVGLVIVTDAVVHQNRNGSLASRCQAQQGRYQVKSSEPVESKIHM